jgi:hypothetical protein
MGRDMPKTAPKRRRKVPRELTQSPAQLGQLSDWVEEHSAHLELGQPNPELDRQITRRLAKPHER